MKIILLKPININAQFLLMKKLKQLFDTFQEAL